MINGQLKNDWFDEQHEAGEYVRKDSQFRNWITADGSAGRRGVQHLAQRYGITVSELVGAEEINPLKCFGILNALSGAAFSIWYNIMRSPCELVGKVVETKQADIWIL